MSKQLLKSEGQREKTVGVWEESGKGAHTDHTVLRGSVRTPEGFSEGKTEEAAAPQSFAAKG